MDKERLLQIAELVVDANDLFRKDGRNTACIRMEISRTPEILIYAHWNGNSYRNTYRYRAISPLTYDNTDPNFDAAEHRIRELVEEVKNGDIISA